MLHLVTGPGEPYVDDLTLCLHCKAYIAPPNPEFWTDDRDAWIDERVPVEYVRCSDVMEAEMGAHLTMSS